MVALSNLQNHSQTRLIKRGARWILEFERCESIDSNVLRPTITSIEGEEFILRHLQSMPDGTMLAAEAMRLIHSADASGPQDRAFEPSLGGWASSPMRSSSVLRVAAGEGGPSDASSGSYVPSASAALAGSMDRVLRRLVRLETRAETDHLALTRQLAAITSALDRLAEHLELPELRASLKAASGSPSARGSAGVGSAAMRGATARAKASEAGVVPGAASAGRDNGATVSSEDVGIQAADAGVVGVATTAGGVVPKDASEGPSPATLRGAASEGAGGAAATLPEQGLSPEAAEKLARDAEAEGRPKLRVPVIGDINRCLKQLIGEQITYREEPKAKQLKVNLTSPDLWASKLLDDEGFLIGAILVDRRAAIMLGGTMLMMGEGALKSEKEPSEDMLSASSEVINVLSSALNAVPGNPHVRTSYIQPISEHTELGWIPRAVARIDVASSLGGLVVIACR